MGFLDNLFSREKTTDPMQKMTIALKELNVLKSEDNILEISSILDELNLSFDKFLEIVEDEINKGKKLLKIINGKDHEGSRNLMHFIKINSIQNLVLKLSELSVTMILLNQAEILKIIDETAKANSSRMFALAMESIVADLYRVAIAISEEKIYNHKNNLNYKFTIGAN